ncbi:MAG: GntR family transcriptional regulator [Kiritimatiellae bacterium]|nr:GntR family transcriptional regulator [Kiritimatiellia bacterium]
MQSLSATRDSYERVERDLREQIAGGRLAVGVRILSERRLCARYGLSRAEVRAVMEGLVRAGLVTRDARRGTFVADSDAVHHLMRVAPRTVLFGYNPSWDTGQQVGQLISEELYHAFETAALADGRDVIVQIGGAFRKKLAAGAGELKKHVCGIVLGGADIDSLARQAALTGLPFVVLHSPTLSQDVNLVSADWVSGGRMAARHLLANGYRRLTFVAPVFSGEPAVQDGFLLRRLGVQRALEEANVVGPLPSCYPVALPGIVVGEEGRAALREHFRTIPPPFGVCSGADIVVPAVYDVLRELGLAVPRDVGVVGYDGQPLAEHLAPPLSTIHIDLDRMGALAWQRLRQLIEGTGPAFPLRQLIPVRLIERDSSRGPASRARS